MKAIRSEQLLDALRDAGIIRVGEGVRSVTITATIGDVVTVTVERLADPQLLDTVPLLASGSVSEVGR